MAALRGGSEGLSIYFTGSTPDSCAPGATTPDTATLVLNVTSLTTTDIYDGVYCYFSFDSSAHLRVPATDFSSLAPDGSGVFYNLQTQLPNRGMFVLSAHATAQPVTLGGECWGRRGPESFELGSLAVSIPPSDWDGTERHAGIHQGAVVASTAAGPVFSDSFTLNYRIGFETPATMRMFIPPYFGNIPQEELTPLAMPDAEIPAPYNLTADFGANPVTCTPSPSGAACRAISGLRLSWNWDGDQSSIIQFQFSIDNTLFGSVGPDKRQVAIIANDSVASVEQILALHCGSGGNIPYAITVVDKHGQPADYAFGVFPAPPCDTGIATVEVTLDNITIGPSSVHHAILDNDTCILCVDNRVELIGYAGLTASRSSATDYTTWQGSAGLSSNPLDFIVNYPIWTARGIMGDVCGLQAAQCFTDPATTSLNWADLELKSPARLRQEPERHPPSNQGWTHRYPDGGGL